MANLKGSKTEENLRQALVRESQASSRYLYFAQAADVEGYPDVALLFRSVAEAETSHAFGHLDFLNDPDETEANLKAAIADELFESNEMYPDFATTARSEGFDAIADWMDSLAVAEKGHVDRLTEGLDSIR